MKFEIEKRRIRVMQERIISYNSDYTAEFKFDEEWTGAVKTVRFIHENGNYIDVVLGNDNTCNIPIFPKGYVKVGVFNDTMTTKYIELQVTTSIKDVLAVEAIAPEEDVYQQIIALIQAGKLKGDKGDAGKDYVISESDYQAIADRVPQPDLSEYVKNTDYATASKGGVIKTDTIFCADSSQGRLVASVRSNVQYANMSNNAFISKGTLENVLAERLKEPQFELIEEITLTEDVASIERSAEPNGTPYNFKAMFYQFSIADASLNPTMGRMSTKLNGRGFLTDGSAWIPKSANPYTIFLGVNKNNGVAPCWTGYIKGIETTSLRWGTRTIADYTVPFEASTNENIVSFGIYFANGWLLPSGTNIKIYGIRA